MPRYRTVIVVPPDRAIVLHLPASFPEGRAIVTVQVEADVDFDADPRGLDHDREDIEWWDESPHSEDEPLR